MAYIIFVNPDILTLAGTADNPFSREGIFVATILASAVGTLVMGLFANVPYAQAPGLGLNAFFAFTVCGVMGFTWQQALAMVFICGVINLIITLTGLRRLILDSLPKVLQEAIGAGIGLFIAYIGIKNAGLLKFSADPGTYITTPTGTVIANSSVVPSLVNFSNPSVQLALIGIILTIILMVLEVKGAILIGIITVTCLTLVEIAFGVNPTVFFPSLPQSITNAKDFFGSVSISPSSVISSISSIKLTAFKLDFVGLFNNPSRIALAITAIVGFVLTDIFDTIGTLIGTGKQTGIFDDEKEKTSKKGINTRLDKALFADMTATIFGSFMGTSNTTTFVESSAGIAVGGRTGLTSVVTAVLFLLCIVLSPIISIIPSCATAPALIIVGILMVSSIKDIDWKKFEDATVAFITVAFMPFSFSITTGIALGFITYIIIKLVKGKAKDVNPVIWGASALFIINFIALSVSNL